MTFPTTQSFPPLSYFVDSAAAPVPSAKRKLDQSEAAASEEGNWIAKRIDRLRALIHTPIERLGQYPIFLDGSPSDAEVRAIFLEAGNPLGAYMTYMRAGKLRIVFAYSATELRTFGLTVLENQILTQQESFSSFEELKRKYGLTHPILVQTLCEKHFAKWNEMNGDLELHRFIDWKDRKINGSRQNGLIAPRPERTLPYKCPMEWESDPLPPIFPELEELTLCDGFNE